LLTGVALHLFCQPTLHMYLMYLHRYTNSISFNVQKRGFQIQFPKPSYVCGIKPYPKVTYLLFFYSKRSEYIENHCGLTTRLPNDIYLINKTSSNFSIFWTTRVTKCLMKILALNVTQLISGQIDVKCTYITFSSTNVWATYQSNFLKKWYRPKERLCPIWSLCLWPVFFPRYDRLWCGNWIWNVLMPIIAAVKIYNWIREAI
jgi:hypothetical protein